MRLSFRLVLLASIAATAACGANPSTGTVADTGSAADAADATGDTAAEDTAADDTSTTDGPGAGDAAAPDDTAADSATPDTTPDTTPDVMSDTTGPTDADQGGDDAQPLDATEDAAADTGADTGTDTATDASKADLPPGAATCQTACQNIAATGCPNEDPLDACIAECQGAQAQASQCASEFQVLLDCATTATLTCKASGKADDAPCEPAAEAVGQCMSGDACTPGPCYAGSGPDGVISCGCSAECKGVEVKLDCNGTECVCSSAGQSGAAFAQGDACDNAYNVMQSECVGP